jgi:hypothetical protein
MVSLAGLLFIVVWEASTYLPRISEGETTYFLQRCLFVVATTVEFPMLQLLLLGMGGWLYAGRRRSRFVRAQHRAQGSTTDRIENEPAEPLEQIN